MIKQIQWSQLLWIQIIMGKNVVIYLKYVSRIEFVDREKPEPIYIFRIKRLQIHILVPF